MGNLVGSAIAQYDENGCSAMVVSITYGRVYNCGGMFSWTYNNYAKVNGVMAKMDFNYFSSIYISRFSISWNIPLVHFCRNAVHSHIFAYFGLDAHTLFPFSFSHVPPR